MKRTLLLICLTTSILFSFAAPIDLDKALGLAKDFYNQDGMQKAPAKTSASVSLAFEAKMADGFAEPLFYVFNKDASDGFIIISGDDRTLPVLGYSDSGTFDETNLPDNFKAWLEGITQELEGLKKSTIPSINFLQSPQNTQSVAPLLGNTAWNQGSPYNLLCPNDGYGATVTGCVATAIAQIMYHHRWPEQGQGSISYRTRTRGLNLSMDFSQSVYDWQNMTPTYNSGSSAQERNAVAKLMLDVGHAVEMDYTSSASGAYSQDIPFAMVEYFNYDENIAILYRDYYTNAEWMNMARKEINENRPIYISGSNSDAGHAFVCDGYDQNDLFHINWGWGGVSNGYFALHSLNPSTQGIGGSTGGYNMSGTMILGIQPPTTDSEKYYSLYLVGLFVPGEDTVGRNEPVTIQSTTLTNKGAKNFLCDTGIGLYKGEQLVEVYSQKQIHLGAGSYADIYWNEFLIPSSVENGQYLLYPVFKTDETDWMIMPAISTTVGYQNVTINTNEIILNSNEFVLDKLSIPEGGFTTSPLYVDKKADFDVTIENTGSETSMTIGVWIYSEDESVTQLAVYDWICIPGNATTDFTFTSTITLPPGEYKADFYITYDGSFFYTPGDSQIDVTVKEEYTNKVELSLLSMQTDKTYYYEGEDIVLSGTLKNEASLFYGDIIVFMIDQESDFYTYQLCPIRMDTGEMKDFSFTLTENLPQGNYYTYLSYRNENNTQDYLTNNNVYYAVEAFPVLERVGAINTDKDSYKNNEDIKIDVGIANQGGFYHNYIYANLYNTGNEPVATGKREVSLNSGDSQNVHFDLQQLLSPGDHYIEIAYYDYEQKAILPLGERKKIAVTQGDANTQPELISASLNINKHLYAEEDMLVADATVYNRGANFTGKVGCYIYKGSEPAKTIYSDVITINNGSEVSLSFQESLNLAAGVYSLKLGYESGSGTVFMDKVMEFEVVNATLLHLESLILNKEEMNQGDKLTVTTEISNSGYPYYGQVRAVIRNADDEIVESLVTIEDIGEQGRITPVFEKDQVYYPYGKYYITIEYLNWEGDAYIAAEGHSTAMFEIMELPHLELVSLTAGASLCEKGETVTFTASVSNSGTLYKDEISLLVYRGDGLVDQLYKPISVDRGETASVQFDKTIDYTENGTYRFYIGCKEGDGWRELGDPVSVNIYAQPILSLTNGIAVNKETFLQGEQIKVTATLYNRGATYSDDIMMVLLNSNSEEAHSAAKNVELKRTETLDIAFEETPNLPAGNYTIKIGYNGKDGKTHFDSSASIVVGPVSIDGVGQSFSVYPNPARDYLNIKSDKAIQSIHLTDITGKTVRAEATESTPYIYRVNLSGLANGIYLLTVKAGDVYRTIKVMKEK